MKSRASNDVWTAYSMPELRHGTKPVNPIKGLACVLILGTILCSSTHLRAQTKPSDSSNSSAGQKAVEADPQSTSATFGDWVLRCNRVETGKQVQRVCEVAQTIIIRGQQAPVAELALGRLKRTDSLRVTVVLPTNVAFPSAPRIYAEAKNSDGFELTWRRCLPNGCFADATPKEEIVRLWRGAKSTGRIETKDAFGRNVVVTISFRGFAQALDALNKEQ